MHKAIPFTAAVLALLGMFAGTPAHAAAESVTCTGTETVSYDPGLTFTQQTVHAVVTGILAPCTSSNPAVTSGTYGEDFHPTLSCLTLLSGRPGERTFHWSNGQTSTFAFNRVLNNAGGSTTVTFTGTITVGAFSGATVLQQVVFVTPNLLQCLAAPGLTSLGTGLSTLTITKLS